MGHNRPVTTDVKEDAVLRDAQGLAHDAVVDEMGAQLVGSHLGFAMEAERFGTHAFACDDPAYVGWQWAMGSERVTCATGESRDYLRNHPAART